MGNDVLPCSKDPKKNVENPRHFSIMFRGKAVGFPQAPLKKNRWSAADFEAGTTTGKSTAVEYTIYWYTSDVTYTVGHTLLRSFNSNFIKE